MSSSVKNRSLQCIESDEEQQEMRWWWSLLVGACAGHRLEGSFSLSAKDRDQRVQYLTKFACTIGECKYRVRAGLKHPNWALQKAAASGEQDARSVKHLSLDDIDKLQSWNKQNKTVADGRLIIRVVLDDEWETSHHMTGCSRAELGRGRTTLNVPLDGSMGPWSWNSFRQSHRPHFWYFFGEDCRNTVATQMAKLINHSSDAGIMSGKYSGGAQGLPPPITATAFGDRLLQIQYEIEIYQVDGGHLSYDLSGLLFWNVLNGILYGALLVTINRRESHRVMDHHHGLLKILNTSCSVNIAATILYTLYIYRIKATAVVSPLFIRSSEICFNISQMLIISCLLLIAPGPNSRTGRKGTTFAGPIPFGAYGQYMFTHPYVLAGVLCTLNILLVQSNWLMMFYRLGLFGLFLYMASPQAGGLAASTSPLGGNAPDLIRKIVLASSIYFIPVIKLLISSAINRYRQKMFIFHATSIIYFLTILSLYRILSHKKFTSQTLLPARVWTLPSHHID